MSKNVFVPFSELAQADLGRVNWQIKLPEFAPAPQLGLNVTLINSLARTAGFKSLQITSYDGNVTAVTPTVNNVNAQGIGTAAGVSTVQREKTFQASYSSERPLQSQLSKYRAQFTGRVSLNTPECLQQVQQSKAAAPLRNPEAWSKVLNGALTAGLRQASYQNLIRDNPLSTRIILGAYAGSIADNVVMRPILGGAMDPTIVYLTGAVGAAGYVTRRILYRDTDAEIPFSVTPFVPLDRAAAVSIISRVNRLIKPLAK